MIDCHTTIYKILLTSLIFQVKFSELTLDMFRMLQTLEREPQEESTQLFDTSPAPGRIPFVSSFLFISQNSSYQ